MKSWGLLLCVVGSLSIGEAARGACTSVPVKRRIVAGWLGVPDRPQFNESALAAFQYAKKNGAPFVYAAGPAVRQEAEKWASPSGVKIVPATPLGLLDIANEVKKDYEKFRQAHPDAREAPTNSSS